MSYWTYYFIFDIQIIERLSTVNSQTIYIRRVSTTSIILLCQLPEFTKLGLILLQDQLYGSIKCLPTTSYMDIRHPATYSHGCMVSQPKIYFSI